MKKVVTFLALTALVFSCAFAQDKAADTQKDSKALLANAGTPDITTRVIQVEDKYSSSHPKATNVDLKLEYTPLTGDVVFSYTCMAASFDAGEALDTSILVLKEFETENQYYKYTYIKKDKVKYFKDGRDVKMVTYKSYVAFSR